MCFILIQSFLFKEGGGGVKVESVKIKKHTINKMFLAYEHPTHYQQE